jgi:hypothetical protein
MASLGSMLNGTLSGPPVVAKDRGLVENDSRLTEEA